MTFHWWWGRPRTSPWCPHLASDLHWWILACRARSVSVGSGFFSVLFCFVYGSLYMYIEFLLKIFEELFSLYGFGGFCIDMLKIDLVLYEYVWRTLHLLRKIPNANMQYFTTGLADPFETFWRTFLWKLILWKLEGLQNRNSRKFGVFFFLQKTAPILMQWTLAICAWRLCAGGNSCSTFSRYTSICTQKW
jgi:hypothetical protein